MTSDFEREERYIVVKIKDLKYESVVNKLHRMLKDAGIPTRECVVVEPDWPIYEQVWSMVQALAEGEPAPQPDTVEPSAWLMYEKCGRLFGATVKKQSAKLFAANTGRDSVPLYTHPPAQPDTVAVDAARDRIARLPAEADDPSGDNLAVTLCTYFEGLLHCPDEEEGEHGWKPWAEDRTNCLLHRIARALLDQEKTDGGNKR